jgi:hypothetical protein
MRRDADVSDVHVAVLTCDFFSIAPSIYRLNFRLKYGLVRVLAHQCGNGKKCDNSRVQFDVGVL